MLEHLFAAAMLKPCARAEDVPQRATVVRDGTRSWSVLVSINR